MPRHHGLGPERGDGPACDLGDRGAALEGARDLREVPRTDQPLGTEDQLLTPAAQRHVCLLAERNHDVREAVHQVELVDERGRPAPSQLAVQRECAPPLGEHAEVLGHVEVSAQPVPGEEVAIGVLGLRGAEQEVFEVLPALADLSTDGQPHILVGTQGNELQSVQDVVGRAKVHPSQDGPVLVEPSG